MSIHLVFSKQGWQSCEPLLNADDQVIFLGDGVYVAATATFANVQVLNEDLMVRGLSHLERVRVIDYTELVQLCAEHTPCVSWNG